MKKLGILIAMAAIGLSLPACQKHNTIIENSNNYHLKIEYYGRVHFGIDGRSITGISRGGYLKYERNDEKLEAENDGHGGIKYELSEYGDPVPLNAQKEFIANAVKVMLQKNHHPDWE